MRRVTNAQERKGFQNPSMERRLKRSGRKIGCPWTGCRIDLIEK